MTAATFTVLYRVPSGWWTAGTFATHAEAVASAAADEARTGWVRAALESVRANDASLGVREAAAEALTEDA